MSHFFNIYDFASGENWIIRSQGLTLKQDLEENCNNLVTGCVKSEICYNNINRENLYKSH